MRHVGIDIEQFVTDPYGSGIQRVLQQLALNWPTDEVAASFVLPHRDAFLILEPEQAASILGVAFSAGGQGNLRGAVHDLVDQFTRQAPRLDEGLLLSIFDGWLLPEVSYLPSVLKRFQLFSQSMHVSMIGYDVLPMSDPANYRFAPGSAANVSEYFRLLAQADSVVCISDYARNSIWDRLRRDRALPMTIAHPGGDHVAPIARKHVGSVTGKPVRFLRLGTLEARKKPKEIVASFKEVRNQGIHAELVFVGKPSASDQSINRDIADAVLEGFGIAWVQDASDQEVHDLIVEADLFLAIGTEGFGIPVLESIALGTPVAYAGIQPAAEIMDGHGAVRLATHDESLDGLGDALATYANPAELPALTSAIDTSRIPRWQDFARCVAVASAFR